MITIEEKLNLFTKLIYDRIEKENENLLKKFNLEYGNLIAQKKEEFEKEAKQLRDESEKNIMKQKLQIISKAKVEEKKIILEKRKEIFDELIKNVMEYCIKFTDSDEYKNMFLRDFKGVLEELKDAKNIEVILTSKDIERFKQDIINICGDKKVEFLLDDNITGGFIINYKEGNMRIDMSMASRVINSREIIGEKLFEVLQ
ncbi:hypothetical protein FDN13_04530 [Caloramator sp. E03]|uniref:V-type ATP synthase subunit E n=1 Tax=Caloramator sp. E03 TaxID=2576307 RepID=UPI001110204C|nr:V-type ATP synthase subunit E [Caloramator sp. E03]QCX33034.1 hypothetical protein FDN13_04530 [Caloramator sp. E03]